MLACTAYAAAAALSGIDRIGDQSLNIAGRVPPAFAFQSLRNQAQAALNARNGALAVARASEAVRRTPIEPGSTALLGAALLARRDDTGAERAFRVAGQMGWRIPFTQVYWMNGALAVGDYEIAATRLDALLRQDPGLLTDNTLLASLEDLPEGRASLAQQLLGQPDWLAPYIGNLSDVSPVVMARRKLVLLEMARRKGVLGCERISPFVEQLLEQADLAGARDVWRAHCPAATHSLVYDPNFADAEVNQDRAQFAWMFIGNVGSTVVLEAEPGASGKTVEIESRTDRPRTFLRQLLMIPHTDYTLSWKATAADGAPSPRILAAIACTNTPADWNAATYNKVSGRWEMAVTPPQECEASWLAFALQPGDGIVRFRDVALTPNTARH